VHVWKAGIPLSNENHSSLNVISINKKTATDSTDSEGTAIIKFKDYGGNDWCIAGDYNDFNTKYNQELWVGHLMLRVNLREVDLQIKEIQVFDHGHELSITLERGREFILTLKREMHSYSDAELIEMICSKVEGH
jgi:hypothetical protein